MQLISCVRDFILGNMTRRNFLIAYVLLLMSFSPYFGLNIKCCKKPSPLVINGKDIFQEAQGSLLLLAFVEGCNKNSRKQVRGLELLSNNFSNMDITDITFIGINKKDDEGIRHLRRRASYRIHQEPAESDIWKTFGVSTNDFLFFDHCGFVVGHLKYPCNRIKAMKGR